MRSVRNVAVAWVLVWSSSALLGCGECSSGLMPSGEAKDNCGQCMEIGDSHRRHECGASPSRHPSTPEELPPVATGDDADAGTEDEDASAGDASDGAPRAAPKS